MSIASLVYLVDPCGNHRAQTVLCESMAEVDRRVRAHVEQCDRFGDVAGSRCVALVVKGISRLPIADVREALDEHTFDFYADMGYLAIGRRNNKVTLRKVGY